MFSWALNFLLKKCKFKGTHNYLKYRQLFVNKNESRVAIQVFNSQYFSLRAESEANFLQSLL